MSIRYEALRLDLENPRLPETVDKTPSSVLRYIYDNGALGELAESMLANGYFEAERMIVFENRDGPGTYTVVEGNRRLATLLILHGAPEADGLRLVDEDPTTQQLEALNEIPCLVVDRREDVELYLAFRHIGGLKTWSPEAKARYLKAMVERSVARDGPDDVFRKVARRIGSNAIGVRNPYLALVVLEHGREELGIDTTYVQYERFGVWSRCMNSGDIRSFISLGMPRTYDEVRDAVAAIPEDQMSELIRDLTPRGERKAVLQDSRDVTAYGKVITDQRAREILRKHDDLEVARAVVEQRSLPDRIGRAATDVDVIMQEVYRLSEVEELADDLRREVERLYGASRSLRAAVLAIIGDER